MEHPSPEVAVVDVKHVIAITVQSEHSPASEGIRPAYNRTPQCCTLLLLGWLTIGFQMAGEAAESTSPSSHEGPHGSIWIAATILMGLAVIVLAWARLLRASSSEARSNPFAIKAIGSPAGVVTSFSRACRSQPQHSNGSDSCSETQASSHPISASLTPSESFVYAAAHDLQEPLRKVKTYLSRLESRTLVVANSEARVDIEQMRRTLKRMQSLLDSLLSLARIQGTGTVFQAVDLGELLREVLADLEPRIIESQAEVSVEGSLPSLEADPIQLRQLLQNLVSNAIKFHAPQQPPRVQILVSVEESTAEASEPPAPSRCEILVRDNGIGFEPEEWPKLLLGFHRQHSRDRFEGTGLGLAICKNIIDWHQGEMSAVSRPNEGTTLRVRLPMTQGQRCDNRSRVPKDSSGAPSVHSP